MCIIFENKWDPESKEDRIKIYESILKSKLYLRRYQFSTLGSFGDLASIVQWSLSRLIECWMMLLISLNMYEIRDKNMEIVESSFASN